MRRHRWKNADANDEQFHQSKVGAPAEGKLSIREEGAQFSDKVGRFHKEISGEKRNWMGAVLVVEAVFLNTAAPIRSSRESCHQQFREDAVKFKPHF
jgi:hypothetical protein